MNFREALDTAKLVIMTGEVPLLIGESGIGKTSLVMEIAKELDYEIVGFGMLMHKCMCLTLFFPGVITTKS